MTPREPLAAVQALYDRSLFLSAHRAAQALGPYREWEGARALLLAGLLCGQLGAQRQAEILIERAYRADPTDPTDPAARSFHASRALRWRGPLAGWRLLRREGELTGADADTLGSWLALHASALVTPCSLAFAFCHALTERSKISRTFRSSTSSRATRSLTSIGSASTQCR